MSKRVSRLPLPERCCSSGSAFAREERRRECWNIGTDRLERDDPALKALSPPLTDLPTNPTAEAEPKEVLGTLSNPERVGLSFLLWSLVGCEGLLIAPTLGEALGELEWLTWSWGDSRGVSAPLLLLVLDTFGWRRKSSTFIANSQ